MAGLFHAVLQPVNPHAKMMVLVQFGVEEAARLHHHRHLHRHLRGQPPHQKVEA